MPADPLVPPDAPLDLLVVAPHPDDAELGAGGTILQSRREGLRVGVVDLTSGEPTPHGTPELRREETDAATRILGLNWRHSLGLPNRSLESTLDARKLLASVFRVTRPRIVLVPHREDAHPDHVASSRLADDARFWSKLTKTDMPGEPYWPPRMFYYFALHLRTSPIPSFVVDISDVIDEKMQAVRAYESQFLTGRPQAHPTLLDDIRDFSRYWGWTIGKAYGEPFASREGVGVNSLRAFW